MDPSYNDMDNSQPAEQDFAPSFASTTRRQSRGACQPHQQLQQNLEFGSSSREGRRYDPVHDSTGWYQADNDAIPTSRIPWTSAHSFSHWPSSSPPHQDWNAYETLQQPPMPPGATNSGFPRSRAYLETPWAGARQNFDSGQSFAYNGEVSFNLFPPATSSPENSISETTVGRNVSQASTSSTPNSQLPAANQGPPQREQMQMMLQQQQQAAHFRAARAAHSVASTPFDPPTRPREDTNTSGSRHHASLQALMEHRINAARATNSYTSRNSASAEYPPTGPPRRRSAFVARTDAVWSGSDEEGDEGLLPVYRQAEYLLSRELAGVDERALAALRGQFSGGKKVPSKEALSTLERVDIKTLKGEDKICSICYNELGTKNPEGVLENPIRLPKCKHLFGDQCIKKWFEDNDTCPYCRDKLPSEVSIGKRESYNVYRLDRERLLAQMRAQQRLAPRLAYQTEDSSSGRSSASTSRNQDEDDYMLGLSLSRNRESNRELYGHGHTSLRTSAGESPESRRRQQARGRIGSNRAAHALARTTSIGSTTRWISSAANAQNSTPNAQLPASNTLGWGRPRSDQGSSSTAGLNRQNSITGSSDTLNGDGATLSPPRVQLGQRGSGLSVEASPPVAVGSGIRPRTPDSLRDFWGSPPPSNATNTGLSATSNNLSGQIPPLMFSRYISNDSQQNETNSGRNH